MGEKEAFKSVKDLVLEALSQSFPTVNAWRNNKNQPYLTCLIRVAELLEVAPAGLIVDAKKRKRPE